jgi:hypothetical protein
VTTPRKAIKARYDAVLARERRQARAVAFSAFESRPFSVWEVLFIPVLVINYLNKARLRDHFVDNFLFTKQLALRGALDLAYGDVNREQVRARIVDETDRLLRETPRDLYAEPIRDAQLAEIELLLDHDLRLLAVEGRKADDLIRAAYPLRSEYEAHLELLLERERAVSRAAMETLGSRADPSLAPRMHAACERIRAKETGRIYGDADDPRTLGPA